MPKKKTVKRATKSNGTKALENHKQRDHQSHFQPVPNPVISRVLAQFADWPENARALENCNRLERQAKALEDYNRLERESQSLRRTGASLQRLANQTEKTWILKATGETFRPRKSQLADVDPAKPPEPSTTAAGDNGVQQECARAMAHLGQTGNELGNEAKAIAILLEHPKWSVADIAKRVQVNPKTPYKWKTFMNALTLAQAPDLPLPRGFKNGETGALEAWSQ